MGWLGTSTTCFKPVGYPADRVEELGGKGGENEVQLEKKRTGQTCLLNLYRFTLTWASDRKPRKDRHHPASRAEILYFLCFHALPMLSCAIEDFILRAMIKLEFLA